MNKNEINVFLRGGLGNQLFQYALGLHVSITQDKKLVVREDLLPESEDEIGGVSRWPNQISHFEHSGRNFSRSHQPKSDTNLFGKFMQAQRMFGDSAPALLLRLGIYGAETSGLLGEELITRNLRSINGYAASRFFALAQRQVISDQLHAIKNPSRTFETLDSEIRAKKPIVVHLRMGDYLSLAEIYGNISTKFIQEGLASLSGADRPPTWIFTQNEDDLGQDLLETINPERVIDSKILNRPIENLMLMSHGGGLICSNSTLSWWAAFLSVNQQSIIVPRYGHKTNAFAPDATLESWKVLNVDK
jgi:hypothetical protein